MSRWNYDDGEERESGKNAVAIVRWNEACRKIKKKKKKVVLDGNEIVHCSVDRWPANSPTLCLRPASATTRRCARVFSTKTTHARARINAKKRTGNFCTPSIDEKTFYNFLSITYFRFERGNFEPFRDFQKCQIFGRFERRKKFLKVFFFF